MAPDRWAEVERIYHDALAREPGERPAFLSEACGGDDALRQEVQSLLGYDLAAGAFLERPALEDEAQRVRQEPAPLLVDRQIDEYRILSLLGEGGMGQVYRAKDLTLGREVALKVLYRSTAGGPDDLRRFEEEARLASVLNHPNIVTIYGVGEQSDLAYIAMELVHGNTLRELLPESPLPMRVSLDLSSQLADALAFAHAHGIIHRDLKPENIMVTPEGRLKVLDFGIAKLQGPRDSVAAGSGVHTEVGTILGTAGYMSPEQAAGQRAVPASDQFSLGTILYEMVTGLRAWKRSTAAETLTAIIREDPPPIEGAAPGVPVALRWVLDRCLAKDPEERYGSTRDLARDLATLRDHLGELSGAEGSGGLAPRPHRRRILLVALACAAALGAAAIFLSPSIRKSPSPDWARIGFRRGIVWSGRFSPDGQTIVYSAAWDGGPVRLFSTRTQSTETRTLDLPPGELQALSRLNELAFLRDASFDRFFVQPGTLVRAGLEGGTGRDILENVQAADWSPDGRELAVAREVAGKVRLEYPLGKTLYESDRTISNMRISRDGAWIAFCEGGGEVTVSALRVSDRQRRVLSEGWFPGATGLAWSADGREIWFTPHQQVRDSSPPLLAVTLAGKRREVIRGPGQLRLYDIAADGRLLLARWDLQLGVRGSSPTSSRETELSITDDSLLADLSGDGSAALVYDRDGLFLRRTDGSPSLRVSDRFDGGRLSPDGKWVLAISPEDSHPMLVPVGAGETRPIGTQDCHSVEWFPDGKRVLCEFSTSEVVARLFAIELATGSAAEIPLAQEVAADLNYIGPLSPDGAFLVGVGHGGDYWIVALAGGASRRIPGSAVSATRDTLPVGWTSDGRRLFVHHGGEVPGRVETFELATGRIEPWKELTPEDRAGIARIGPVRVAADGHSWAYTYIRVLSNLYVVEGLK